MFRYAFVVIFFGFTASIGSAAQNNQSSLAILFSNNQAAGTLVLERLSDGRRWAHNKSRANKLFIPASTFKIPHTIIALELGIVSSVDAIQPWDGKIRRIRSWNRPQSLRAAIRNSTVPIYQSFARKIGMDRMSRMVSKINYGNTKITTPVDLFWLQGPLRISPNQQIEFLKRLYRRELPVSRKAQDDTIDILKRDEGAGFIHRGKTGWEIASQPPIGWYVGWHETEHDVVFFALNMDMTQKHHQRARIQIVKEAIQFITSATE